MKIPIHVAEILRRLSDGEVISSGKAKHALREELVNERII